MNVIEDVIFLDKENTSRLLGTKDEYIMHYTEADIMLRGGKSIDNILEIFTRQALDWKLEEIEKIKRVLCKIDDTLNNMNFKYTIQSFFVAKTTGLEEGGEVFYTRGNALVISEGRLSLSIEVLYSNLSHELFHVFSKQNESIRTELYKMIGFKKCENLLVSDVFKSTMVTNPDGMELYYRKIKDCCFVPVILKKNNTFGKLFEDIGVFYPKLKILENCELLQFDKMNRIIQLSKSQHDEYVKEVGGEIIFNDHHPDEILADIFCYLLSEGRRKAIDTNVSVMKIFAFLFYTSECVGDEICLIY